MATDPNTSTRDELTRDAGTTRNDLSDRERNLEARREGAGGTGTAATTRRSNVTRRTPYYGAGTSPFQVMRRMAEDIDRMFSDVDFARGFGLQSPQRGSGLFDPWRFESRLADTAWTPQVETFRRDNNLVIRADLPGLNKDNISIETDDDVLIISGERSDETRDERDDFYRSERTYGRFFRAVQLPEGIDTDKIDATFKDGVLEVTIPAPKVTTPKNRQIKIK
jgi:HSP20 family protein